MANEAAVRLPSPVLLIKATLPVLRSRVGLLSAFRWDRAQSSLDQCAIVTYAMVTALAENDQGRSLKVTG